MQIVKTKARWMCMACLCLASAPCLAQEKSSTPVSLRDLIAAAFNDNPEIRAAHAQWAQAVERYPQETALDDPMLSFSYYIENVETRVGPQEYSVGFSQKFPFPGTLRQKGRVVEKDIETAEVRYERVVRDVIADLKKAAHELTYLDGAVEITTRNHDLLREILAYAQTRYTDRDAGLNDLFRAESQLAQLDYDLITLRELRAVQRSVVNAIINRAPEHELGPIAASIPEPVTPSLEALDELTLQRSQEIRLAELGVEKWDETTALAHKRNLPSFTIGVNHIGTGDADNPAVDDSGQDPLIVSGGLTVPLWFKKSSARVRYAEEGRRAAAERRISAHNAARVALRKALFRFENARRLVILYREHLIPQAERSIEIAEEWNRTREGSVTEVLETQSVWLNFNLAHLRAKVDYAQALAELERIAGGSLTPALRKE